MRYKQGNDLIIGPLSKESGTLKFSRSERDKHFHICGGTGTGKSKFLEHLIRQDILAWQKSKCGLLLIDPHGNLYDNIVRWLAWRKIDRPVIPIDLRQDDWVVSYNLLRQRKDTDPAVLVDNIVDAMSYVWGQSGVSETPRFARWASNVLRPLYEKNRTLIDAEYLVDFMEKRMRNLMTADLDDKVSQRDWQFADMLNVKDFDTQIGSTVNRLRSFIKTQKLREIFGQPDVSFDFGKAMEEGQIVIVNLATKGNRISQENARLFGTLLFSDLWNAAKDRGKEDNVKPFYVYVDEFQEFVTPTIAKNLDQARGFGLHLTLAHQFPRQLLNEGDAGRKVFDSVMENASSKLVFRLTYEENLSIMAKWLFMGVMNPDEIKHQLYSTKVMQYVEELKVVESFGESSGYSYGSQTGRSSGAGMGGTEMYGANFDSEMHSHSESQSEFAANSSSENESTSESSTHSKSYVPTLVPKLGKELSSVQFRSLEEQLFRAMAVLFDQQERHGVARLVGMNRPVSIRTPDVNKTPGSAERTKKYLEACYAKIPFALPASQAQKQLADHAENFRDVLLKELKEESVVAKRKIR